MDGNVVVCYNKSFSIENQLNIDNLILSRWNAAMNNGYFRFVFVPLAEKLISNFGSKEDYSCRYSIDSVREKILPGKFRFLVQYQPNRSTNRRPPQNMTSVSQEFNPDKFNFTRINREKELVCELRNKDCDKSSAEARDVVIINVSPIDLGHCLLVPELELCRPQVNMYTRNQRKSLSLAEYFCIHDHLLKLLSFISLVTKLDIDTPRNPAGFGNNSPLKQT